MPDLEIRRSHNSGYRLLQILLLVKIDYDWNSRTVFCFEFVQYIYFICNAKGADLNFTYRLMHQIIVIVVLVAN